MRFRLMVGILASALLSGLGHGAAEDPAREEQDARLRQKVGIRVESLRLTAAGFMLDFRFRVIDPEKAVPLFKRKNDPYAIDLATGQKLAPPNTKLGKLSPTATPLLEHVYFMMFANTGQRVKAGAKITIIIDEIKIEGLTVE